jgi:hypothetical protein
MKQHGKARDHNEQEIIAALTNLGCIVWKMDPPRVDLLVGVHQQWVPCEIKQPKGTLTIGQLRQSEICDTMNLPFRVLRSVADAVALVRDMKP